MCGITAIINKSGLSTNFLAKANGVVAHRGPDDEGFLLWNPEHKIRLYAGKDTAPASLQAHQLHSLPPQFNHWKVGLGHRRLSILDLSPLGHQPMVLNGELALTYNGEVYNYLEIRKELTQLEHVFKTRSDTEVILHAWLEWGQECLHRFNGMFAFILLDIRNQKLYAVRDRFGIKPLYYSEQAGYLTFASEVKQLRVLPEYEFKLHQKIALHYLRYGSVDRTDHTFEMGIEQIPKGSMLEFDLETYNWSLNKWYQLKATPWEGNFSEACEEFYRLLKDSVRLRMRSDVPVGSALSGGLDSSTIVCLMREVLEEQGKGDHLIKTITSCQHDKKYDEWKYAELVIQKTRAKPYRVFPTFEKLLHDLDRFIWHLDYPFTSTSQFSQWSVFEGAAAAGLKVMIDGQGADEQLAGYTGTENYLYAGLLGKGKWMTLFKSVLAYQNYNGYFPARALSEAVQNHVPETVRSRIPAKYRIDTKSHPDWIIIPNDWQTYQKPKSLEESLCRQVLRSPLPALLRYEDRNSMAFSIESRVPFMDHRLIEFTLGLPIHFVYSQGERRYILRKTFAGLVPDEIMARRDKMGFVSPEEKWLKNGAKEWFLNEIDDAGNNMDNLIDKLKTQEMVQAIITEENAFSLNPWHILNLNRFIKMAAASQKHQKAHL